VLNSGERIGGSVSVYMCMCGGKENFSAGERMARVSVKTIFITSLLVCLLAAKGKVTFSRYVFGGTGVCRVVNAAVSAGKRNTFLLEPAVVVDDDAVCLPWNDHEVFTWSSE
jgi:hypothetical protein